MAFIWQKFKNYPELNRDELIMLEAEFTEKLRMARFKGPYNIGQRLWNILHVDEPRAEAFREADKYFAMHGLMQGVYEELEKVFAAPGGIHFLARDAATATLRNRQQYQMEIEKMDKSLQPEGA